MLGTSKTKQDGKKFELFITTAPIPDLNDKLIVFGRVIKGEDVVQVANDVLFFCSCVWSLIDFYIIYFYKLSLFGEVTY